MLKKWMLSFQLTENQFKTYIYLFLMRDRDLWKEAVYQSGVGVCVCVSVGGRVVVFASHTYLMKYLDV